MILEREDTDHGDTGGADAGRADGTGRVIDVRRANDAATGRALAQVGGIETLRLIESDDPVPGLARADALMWRERLAARITSDLPNRVAETLGGEFSTAGIVSYGSQVSGARAAEHLRLIAAGLNMPTVATQLALSLVTDFEAFTTFAPTDRHRAVLRQLLDRFPDSVSSRRYRRSRTSVSRLLVG